VRDYEALRAVAAEPEPETADETELGQVAVSTLQHALAADENLSPGTIRIDTGEALLHLNVAENVANLLATGAGQMLAEAIDANAAG